MFWLISDYISEGWVRNITRKLEWGLFSDIYSGTWWDIVTQTEKRLPSLFILSDICKSREGQIKFVSFGFILCGCLSSSQMEFNSIEWKGRNNRQHKPQIKCVGSRIWDDCKTSALALSKLLLSGFVFEPKASSNQQLKQFSKLGKRKKVYTWLLEYFLNNRETLGGKNPNKT